MTAPPLLFLYLFLTENRHPPCYYYDHKPACPVALWQTTALKPAQWKGVLYSSGGLLEANGGFDRSRRMVMEGQNTAITTSPLPAGDVLDHERNSEVGPACFDNYAAAVRAGNETVKYGNPNKPEIRNMS
ncbi:jg1565 [Pararge aegeria aegeria]|uniref:Jg1565 protein n=1 Tax=Pararge aegeria aegeria TaxID=348720 RepID=A0A8S4R9M0_9NEOP|nr:jg1565 [Pararge aegeria aegeria]